MSVGGNSMGVTTTIGPPEITPPRVTPSWHEIIIPSRLLSASDRLPSSVRAQVEADTEALPVCPEFAHEDPARQVLAHKEPAPWGGVRHGVEMKEQP
jgi:hypothetical protein